MSPSYPSGHSLESFVICDVLAYHFPKNKEIFDAIKRRVAISRIIIGAHYPSDNDFSRIISEEIKSHPKMQEIYYNRDWESIITKPENDVPGE